MDLPQNQIIQNLTVNTNGNSIVGIFIPKQEEIKFFRVGRCSLLFYYSKESVDTILKATKENWMRASILGIIDHMSPIYQGNVNIGKNAATVVRIAKITGMETS